jgi:hypothetical protein
MINHVAPLTFESGFFAALDEKPRHAPWWLSCTVSSPFAAFAARLLASDSLAEAVFSHLEITGRPAGRTSA